MSQETTDLVGPVHNSNDCGFGKTVTVSISRTGEMTTCITCRKTHRAFVRPEKYYNGTTCECDWCCPVIKINLPNILIQTPTSQMSQSTTGKASKKRRHKKRH